MTEFSVVSAAVEKLSNRELVKYYNELVTKVPGRTPVKKFETLSVGQRRLTELFLEVEKLAPKSEVLDEVETKIEAQDTTISDVADTQANTSTAEAPKAKKAKTAVAEDINRKKRDKVFCYPPAEVIKTMAPGSLRAQARDLLMQGATFGQVEDLIRTFDDGRGKTPEHRIPERAYGLVRLLHTYIGYALREEGKGDDKLIFVMTPEQWKAYKQTS